MTGGIGSGKSTVARLFSSIGVPIIDTDVIARDIVEPGKSAWHRIVTEFGEDYLNPDQTINRKKLAKLVFNDKEKKIRLESILHPEIYQEVLLRTDREDFPYCVIVIPLLLETGAENRFDRILVIDVPENLQLQRTMARENISEEMVKQIMESQVSRAQRIAVADDVINNSLPMEQLHNQVEDLHQKYLSLAKN